MNKATLRRASPRGRRVQMLPKTVVLTALLMNGSCRKADPAEAEPRFPIGHTVEVGKCRFEIREVVKMHGDTRWNWGAAFLALVKTTDDVATECAIDISLMTPSGKVMESSSERRTAEVGYEYQMKEQVLSQSQIDDVQVRIDLRSEPGMVSDGARRELFIKEPTPARSHAEMTERTMGDPLRGG